MPLKEETKNLNALLKDLARLAQSYIKTGLLSIPNLLLTILEQVEGQIALSTLSHILSSEKSKLNSNRMSQWSELNKVHTHHQGAIAGAFQFLSGEHEKLIERQLCDGLTQVTKQKQSNMTSYATLMYRSVAFLQRCKVPSLDLIRSLCQLPIYLFNEAAMKIAVDCWTWLLVLRPDLEHLLMFDISRSWIYSVETRRGIFCDSAVELSPVEAFTQAERPPHSSPIPHRIFLYFIHERIIVTSNQKAIGYLFEIARRSLYSGFT